MFASGIKTGKNSLISNTSKDPVWRKRFIFVLGISLSLISCGGHPPYDPNWVSSGEKVLFQGVANSNRDDGIEAFKDGDFELAVKRFEEAVFSNSNDPEVQIYLNNSRAASQESSLKIAAVVPIDENAKSAQEMLRGIADAQTLVNDEGGAGGKLVQVIIANDGNDPERARGIARELAVDYDILGVIGHNSSDASKAALTEYKVDNLAMISPTSTSIDLQDPLFFRTVPSDRDNGKKLAEYAEATGIEKVAVFYNPDSAYSNSLRREFENSFTQSNGSILNSIEINDDNFDPKQQIEMIRGQVDAIALFPNTNTRNVAIGLARANTELFKTKLPMLGGDTLYSVDTLNSGAAAVDGLVIAIPWFPISQEYAKRAEKRWKGAVNWRTAASFDATLALLKALENDTELTRDLVRQNLRDLNISSSETSGEPLAFSSGERRVEPILVKIVPDASGRPRDLHNGFQLIKETVPLF
ncbi:MAG: ABC transporter substrate-binding protein [Cyanobacteria bacterium P01_F01_bin.143]